MGEFSSFLQELDNWGWNVFTYPFEENNLDIIKNFFANVKPYNVFHDDIKGIFVRGIQVAYDRNTIHEYMEDAFVDNPNKIISFWREVVRNRWEYDRINVGICIRFETYKIWRYGLPIQFKEPTSPQKHECGRLSFFPTSTLK